MTREYCLDDCFHKACNERIGTSKSGGYMTEYRDLNPQQKASYLVDRKGEMSVELWNDRAQCVLAPMIAELAAARERIEKLEVFLSKFENVTIDYKNEMFGEVEGK